MVNAYILGLNMGLNIHEINTIKYDLRKDPFCCTVKKLLLTALGKGKDFFFEKLADAVRECGVIGSYHAFLTENGYTIMGEKVKKE